jgi:tetratricopeptide (TPR) repeat protein
MKRAGITLIVLSVLVSGAFGKSMRVHFEGEPYPADKIVEIAESSSYSYIMGPLSEEEYGSIKKKSMILTPDYYLELTDDGYTLNRYEPTDEILALYDSANTAFDQDKFDTSMIYYRRILKLYPGYYAFLTYIGDCFYLMQQYDSAVFYLDSAIKANYIDYSAHWFLADTYWKMDRRNDALKEITIAHILNRNHPDIKKGVQKYREGTGRKFDDWVFHPEYTIKKSNDSVFVNGTESPWVLYGLVKALWKYEPGYAEDHVGNIYNDEDYFMTEEIEALSVTLSSEEIADLIDQVVQKNYLTEFIFYEIILPETPLVALGMNNKFMESMVEYINKFH